MSNTPQVPSTLRHLQEWFSAIITQPIGPDNSICPTTPAGSAIEEEAKRYISASTTLEPHERLEIYSQQYWWRLLNTLHDNFPLTTRLLGYKTFNRTIGFPYFAARPPHHWSLSHLGDTLPQWIADHYNGDNKVLINEAAQLDWAYVESFFAAEYRTNTFIGGTQNPTILAEMTLLLQPHLFLFAFSHCLPKFRDRVIEEPPDYWQLHDFPPLERKEAPYHYVASRNGSGNVTWHALSDHAYTILSLFRNGNTLNGACCWIEQQEPAFIEEVCHHLHDWFQEWTIRSWIGHP